MFNFIKEVMAPTTRSSSLHQQQQQQKDKEHFEDSVKTEQESLKENAVIKGYKITDNERSRKYGIGANSLQMLKTKAKLKFPVSIFLFGFYVNISNFLVNCVVFNLKF